MNDRIDQAIIRAFLARSESAIADLRARYGSVCEHIAAGILTDERDLEECLNDAYLQLWNSIPPADPSSLRAYLFTTVRNTALIRRRQNQAKKRGGSAGTTELFDELAITDNVQDEFDAKLLSDALNRFLASLPSFHRVIFLRRYYYGMSIAEIAKVCSHTQNGVKVTLSRIRKSLKDFLEKEGFPL